MSLTPRAALAAAFVCLVPAACRTAIDPVRDTMPISSERFGEIGGREIRVYTLTNTNGMTVRAMNYGAAVTQVLMPDSDANIEDIVLGFDTLDEYVAHTHYFGCTAGRVANRIAAGRFELDGKTYTLAVNNGPNHLHGGVKGLDKVVWDAETVGYPDRQAVRFTYRSPAGEEGYPGNLDLAVEYVLNNDNELRVVMTATTDAPTPVNLVHHSYWNLAGHDSGPITTHDLMINASRYTPADSTYIPTGEILPVANTPYEFQLPLPIALLIDAVPPANAEDPGGYDLNYVVDGDPGTFRLAAVVLDPESGRSMEVWANQPGLQFYTGNWISDLPGKNGATYDKHAGLCLETQAFPDSINHQGEPGWPDVILRPGERYEHVMVHKFRAE